MVSTNQTKQKTFWAMWVVNLILDYFSLILFPVPLPSVLRVEENIIYLTVVDEWMQAWKLWRNGTPLEFMDPTTRNSFTRNEVIRCIHMGLLCVQEDPDDRPSMASVLLMLSSYSVTLPLPQQPAFFNRTGTLSDFPIMALESDQSASKSMPWSVNEASITDLYPR